MVVIHSRQTDITTIRVIKWLIYFKKNFFRLNHRTEFQDIYSIMPFSYYMHGIGLLKKRLNIEQDSVLETQIQQYLSIEDELILDNFYFLTPDNKKFGNHTTEINKLNVLHIAKNAGMKVPSFSIVTRKKDLINFFEQSGNSRLICKAIGNGAMFNTPKFIIDGQRTEEITKENLASIPSEFSPTFIQELIESKFEVRAFCYNNKIEAIATFVVSYEQERPIDIRNRQEKVQKREIPFQVPKAIEDKIFKLFAEMELNSGSVDLLVTDSFEYYFLEVNPHGQYGFVSMAGNYNIEKRIAQCL